MRTTTFLDGTKKSGRKLLTGHAAKRAWAEQSAKCACGSYGDESEAISGRLVSEACRNDVARLGLDGATAYQMKLIADRQAMGDERWDGISAESMRVAFSELIQ